MERLLDGLTVAQLEKAVEVAERLFDNVSQKRANRMEMGRSEKNVRSTSAIY